MRGEFAMKTTCLINSYNYRHFVGEAIESALTQTVPFTEIIVVDDGSTDGSADWLRTTYDNHRTVQIVCKENAGQLSCFNEGFHEANGDVLFFLDADDRYRPEFLERMLSVYENDRSLDFVFCNLQPFGHPIRRKINPKGSGDLGYSAAATYFTRYWAGNRTSCLSMRKSFADRFLPLPLAEDWRTRADDCLVFGASLAGAHKYHLATPLVDYRIHNGNTFAGQRPTSQARYRRRLALTRLFEHVLARLGYNPAGLADLIHREFDTIADPTWRDLARYYRTTWHSRLSIWRRLLLAASITGAYLAPRRSDRRNAARGDSTEDQSPPRLADTNDRAA
jgi:glycosyltransferase involved in cell wall biosynthesis